MLWQIRIAKSAERELDELPDPIRNQAIAALSELQEDPCPPGTEAVRGRPNRYKVRLERGYRLVYQVSRQQRRIVLLRARPHETAYLGFE